MRTMALALGCSASVIAGAMLSVLEGPVVLGILAALGVLALVWLRTVAEPSAASRWRLAAACLVVIGLARGASLAAPEPPRVLERGWPTTAAGGPMREFEVVGASEPGARCVIELRDPRDRTGSLRVSAPPERCPLAEGDRVAVIPQSLAWHWRDALDVRDATRNLGRGPVVWRRPTPEPQGIERIRRGYWHRVAALRQRAWSATRGDPSASLVVAIGLGLRSALAPEQRERLRAAGLGHLIAVSGLHVAVAAVWLQALARRGVVMLGGSPSWACVIAWIPLWSYVGLTGAAASAIRAALMLTGIDLAILAGRPSHGPTLLASAAAAMLIWQPQWLFEPGFGLSLAAMAAIVTAPRELGVLAMSWRITWATAPLSVLWFEVAPLHGLLGNALALPIFALLMPLSLLAGLGPGLVGELALGLAKLGAAVILDLAGLLAELPSAGSQALVALAVLGLICRRIAPLIRLEASSGWLPPRLACVLALVVGLGSALDLGNDEGRSNRREFDWVALGSVHSRSLLLADPSQPGSACLHRPTDSAATWLGVFDLLGVRRLSRVDPRLPGVERDDPDPALDPGAVILLEQLERSGIAWGRGARCEAPEPERVREALRACRYRQGGRGRVLVRSLEGVISCRIGDRWVVAPELADPDI